MGDDNLNILADMGSTGVNPYGVGMGIPSSGSTTGDTVDRRSHFTTGLTNELSAKWKTSGSPTRTARGAAFKAKAGPKIMDILKKGGFPIPPV